MCINKLDGKGNCWKLVTKTIKIGIVLDSVLNNSGFYIIGIKFVRLCWLILWHCGVI